MRANTRCLHKQWMKCKQNYATRFVLVSRQPTQKQREWKEYAVFESPLVACEYAEKSGERKLIRGVGYKNRPVTLYFRHGQAWYMFDYNVIKQHFCAFKSFLQTDTDLKPQHSSVMQVVSTKHRYMWKCASLHRALFMSKDHERSMNGFFRIWMRSCHRWSTPTRRYYPGHQRTLELSKLQDVAHDQSIWYGPVSALMSTTQGMITLIGCYSEEQCSNVNTGL
jgi:hypothetical protein